MNTFILVWNPDAWTRGDAWLDESAGPVNDKNRQPWNWSMGARRSGIDIGDRAFLLRQRRDRGLVASGFFTSNTIYPDEHWDGTGRQTWYADLEWDCVLRIDERLAVEDLKTLVPDVQWDRLQGSGVQVPAGVDDALERHWASHVGGHESEVHADEVLAKYDEGGLQRVVVNRYERNRAARDACLAHHGRKCSVCGFDFEATYGPIGRRGIHVHHLIELSVAGEGYQVDPINDLIPVCPNCHAMLHTASPALSPAALRKTLQRP
jgi:5-methylcytosine-specific restriction enzyme A